MADENQEMPTQSPILVWSQQLGLLLWEGISHLLSHQNLGFQLLAAKSITDSISHPCLHSKTSSLINSIAVIWGFKVDVLSHLIFFEVLDTFIQESFISTSLLKWFLVTANSKGLGLCLFQDSLSQGVAVSFTSCLGQGPSSWHHLLQAFTQYHQVLRLCHMNTFLTYPFIPTTI